MKAEKAQITPADARGALAEVSRRRLTVIQEVGIPQWYWWALAVAWIGLGVSSDLAAAWVTTAATFAFGTVHATVAPRVVSGRHGTSHLSVRADIVGRRIAWVVLAGLVALVPVTVGLAVAAHADGARHPATFASIPVAIIVVLGGPRLVSVMRRRLAAQAR